MFEDLSRRKIIVKLACTTVSMLKPNLQLMILQGGDLGKGLGQKGRTLINGIRA